MFPRAELASGGEGEMGKWLPLMTLDTIGSSGFSYEFHALESASISGSSNTEEKFGPKLAGHTIQSSTWAVFQDHGDAIYDISLPPHTAPTGKASPRSRAAQRLL